MTLVDLSKQPYNLDQEAIDWVETTIANMTLEEKIGQLFVNMGASREEEYLTDMVQNYHIGAVRYNPGTASEVYDQNKILQTKSKIPLLIAANTEAGGNGAVTDGTKIGYHVKVAATNERRYAYELGRVSGVEAAAAGCNWSFAPIVDITMNWRNPIIQVRAFGDDPDKVLDNSLAYMEGIMEEGILPAAKHFPGDGVDERDHHLSFAPNTLSKADWDASFGKVYQGLIDAGLPSIMAGHIHLPAYEKHFNPDVDLSQTLPASLSKTVLTDLLKGQMNFNGLVVTDASHMVAMTSSMKRSEMVPTAIAAGCDLFLFFNDEDEDFGYMMDGYKRGILSEERLHDALRRTLGLKARLRLHDTPREEIMLPKEEAMAKIGLENHQRIAEEVADKAVTLVKDKQKNLWPVTPERYQRVLLVDVKGIEGGFGTIFASEVKPVDVLKEVLEVRGFEVEIWQSVEDEIKGLPLEEQREAIRNVYAQKQPITNLTDNYDLIINVADVAGGATVQRIVWPASKGTPDIPFYVHELPTIFISVDSPFHLADVPQVGTLINAYDGDKMTLEKVVEKMTGESDFTGVSPVDTHCGFFDTHIWRD